MEQIKIKTELPPVRCEICHQTDSYDPATNSCRRCADAKIEKKTAYPLANNQTNNQTENRLNILSDLIKPIFIKWELLRIAYNLILIATYLSIYLFVVGLRIFQPILLLVGLTVIGAIMANICFLAGPIIESYIAWLGFRSKLITIALFVGGVLISIPCVLFFLPFVR